MATIEITGDELVVELTLAEKFMAARGSLHIPLSHIEAVRVANESAWKMMWRKIIGTNAPPWKMAGTFFLNGGFVFCDFSDGARCIEVDLHDETYKQLIVQLDESTSPEDAATQIKAAIVR